MQHCFCSRAYYGREAELQKWWLFARCEQPTCAAAGWLFIAIYDLGAGIPSTMRNQLKTGERLLDFMDTAKGVMFLGKGSALDQRLIKEAVEHKRSQTGQPHRGNGLPEMRQFAEGTKGGRLHIVSGHAQYTYPGGSTGGGQTAGFRSEFPGPCYFGASH